jgi:cytochrome b6-f complex iron-sulfur subunit
MRLINRNLDDAKNPMTRRDFIRFTTRFLAALSGLVGLGGLVRFLSYQPEPPAPRKFEAGLEDDYPLQSHTTMPQIPAILIRSKNGFHAFSLVCTHLGCTVQEQAGELACPCHGSRFDEEGNVTKRPAGSSLKALRVEVSSDGKVIIYA